MSGRVAGSVEDGWALLRALPELRLAGVVDGRPVVRTLHHAVHDGRIWLHAPPRSTLAALAGTPVQLVGDAIVARIPSWMRDPERACPATTFYRSVIVDGVLEPVTSPDDRAAALQQMMRDRQPEGGHVPIDAAHPLYAAPVRGLGIWAVRPTAVSAAAKLGTNLSAAEIGRIAAGLWQRGGDGDLAAIDVLADTHPSAPCPVPLPAGLRLRLHPDDALAAAAGDLVHHEYWNGGQPRDQLAAAVRHSAAWIGLQRDGALIATARAVSDRTKRCWLYDVAVHPDHRGGGVGSALIAALLDHPAVRGAEVSLGTRDAQPFYARFGFASAITEDRGAWQTTWMRRPRH
ncbi:MAG: GNAT family N-acetyltransferase [Myxococcota bacterium]